MRLAVVTSHPIQYQAPLFRELAARLDLAVFFACRATPLDQAKAGFGVPFDWDIDLTSGYESHFLANVSRRAGPDRLFGCDTPEIDARLRKGCFDGVLLMGWHLKTYWQAIWTAKRIGLPILVRGDSQLATPRGMLKRLGKELIYPGALRMFDAALYVGERSRAYYEHYGFPSTRLLFSPHCVDTDWFAAHATADAGAQIRSRLGIAANAKVALFAGKLVPFKRPFDVVSAVAAMPARSSAISVVVAGAGPLEADLAAAAAAAGVSLHRLGFCNQSEMPKAYAAADVLVLPSESRETWGLVANEAQACGVPILVSDACGCAPDLAGDGTAGYVFPVGDTQALSDALQTMFDHPPPRTSILEKSARYCLAAAAGGIEEALAFAVAAAADRSDRGLSC